MASHETNSHNQENFLLRLPRFEEPKFQDRLDAAYARQKKLVSALAHPQTQQWLAQLITHQGYQDLYFLSQPEYTPLWLTMPQPATVFFDVEGKFDENQRTGFGLAVTGSETHGFRNWNEQQIPDLVNYLGTHDQIVIFDGRFDLYSLSPYTNIDEMQQLHNLHFDLSLYIQKLFQSRFRIGLNRVSQGMLGEDKYDLTEHGLSREQISQALYEGNPYTIAIIQRYCAEDVKLTAQIYQGYGISAYQRLRYFELQIEEVVHRLDMLSIKGKIDEENPAETISTYDFPNIPTTVTDFIFPKPVVELTVVQEESDE